ncbi:CLUMA_CG015156, isoform A [Clunio marinus]|uniref:CLUMA_CG015156, isoform A n=1 Tax=Clunio marinus TaxID=568069 RepID=A0A1J1IRL1_9DIPT|nr:CLUMA_CG015156, isoform A [Clunio marinus]
MSINNIPNELTVLKKGIQKDVEVSRNKEFHRKSQWIQIACSLMANATVLSSGMGLGFPAITLEALKDKNNPLKLSDDEASWFVCPLGGILSATILDQLGRKLTLTLINIFSIISWSLLYFSSSTNFNEMYWQIMLARFLIGITIGLSSSPAAVYSAEIATPKLRGRLTVLTSMAIAVGVLMIYVLGYFFPSDWRIVSGIAAIFCVFTMILIYFIPESPTWLIARGRNNEARKALAYIRAIKSNEIFSNESLNEELEHMHDQIISRNSHLQSDSLWRTLRKPEIFKPLVIINSFFAFQQFSGTFVIIVYATQFAEEAGAGIDKFLCTVLIGLSRVLATIILAYFILDKYGRKPPTIFSGIGMTLSMIILSLYSSFEGKLPFSNWVTTAFLLVYIITSTFGFLTIPFTMLPEMFPQRVRGITAGITVCIAYFMSFLVIKSYPSMLNWMGNGMIFLFYGTISFLGTLFVCFVLPETKGKTLQEIENLFKSRKSSNIIENLS